MKIYLCSDIGTYPLTYYLSPEFCFKNTDCQAHNTFVTGVGPELLLSYSEQTRYWLGIEIKSFTSAEI